MNSDGTPTTSSLHTFLHIPAYGAQLQVTSLAWGDCFLHTYLEMLFWFFCPIVLNKFLLEESTSCSGYYGVSLRSLTLSCYTSELSGQWRVFQTWLFCVTHAEAMQCNSHTRTRTNFLRVYPHYPDIHLMWGINFSFSFLIAGVDSSLGKMPLFGGKAKYDSRLMAKYNLKELLGRWALKFSELVGKWVSGREGRRWEWGVVSCSDPTHTGGRSLVKQAHILDLLWKKL